MTNTLAEQTSCSTIRHIRWSLATDWESVQGGRPLEDGWVERATSWRAGRPGTRAWAAALQPIPQPSWGALQQAHARAGLDQAFRTGPAYCRGRTYGIYPGLDEQAIRKLNVDGAEDAQPTISPVARGIRGFLDICHIHPFADGNARAACTWLTWCLVGAGLNVPDLRLLMRLPKPPANPLVPKMMATLLT